MLNNKLIIIIIAIVLVISIGVTVAIIIANNENRSNKKADNQGQAWSPSHEECLIDLFNKNVPVSEIAATLMRTETGVRAKLKKMGLIDNRSDAR